MKAFFKEKAVEIGLTMFVSFVLLFSSFYYGTQNDIRYLKTDNIDIHVNLDNHEHRLNQKDIQTAEMQRDIKYIIDMLEDVKEKISE